MGYKRAILILMMVVGLCSLAFAASPTMGTYAQSSPVNVTQGCTINGTFCDSCVITTVEDNEKTKLVQNESMTLDNGEFFFYLDGGNTSVLGRYTVRGYCNYGSDVRKIFTYYFTITPNGYELSTSQGIVYIVFLIALIFVFMLTLYGAIKIPFHNARGNEGEIISVNNLKYFKVMLMALTYILLMFIFGTTRSITANYLLYDNASRVFNFLYQIMLGFLWPVIVCSLFFTFVLFINSKKLKKAIERGARIT